MAIKYVTNGADVRVYDNRGTDTGKRINPTGTTVSVSGALASVKSRGLCWPISSPHVGYVLEGHLRRIEVPDSPPPPPPDDNLTPFSLKVDGFKLFQGNLEKE